MSYPVTLLDAAVSTWKRVDAGIRFLPRPDAWYEAHASTVIERVRSEFPAAEAELKWRLFHNAIVDQAQSMVNVD